MIRQLQIVLLILASGFSVLAQNPVQWDFSEKKLDDKKFEIHLTATIQAPWHLYSQFTPEGGPVRTSISFNKNPLAEMQGPAIEVGQLIQKHEDVFGIDVKYFNEKVDFVQTVKLKTKDNPSTTLRTNVAGSIEFMVCNDRQCLPPKTIPFTISLK